MEFHLWSEKDTLIQNKLIMKNIILVLLCLSTIGCLKEKKENECLNDQVIKYKYDSVSFWFIKDYENIDLKNTKIIHIQNNRKTSINYNVQQKDSKIKIKNIENLMIGDTIKLLLNDKTKFDVSDFRNAPTYGGKNFLGCILSGYTINNVKRSDAMHGTITIY